MTDQTHQSTDAQSRQMELQELRREIRQKQSHIRDNDELWIQSNRWVVQSHDQPVGNPAALVQSALAQLKDDPDHKLYDHPGVDYGEDAFPDQCEGCPHYGIACPNVRQPSMGTLERILDETEDAVEFQSRMYQYANRNHCHVIRNKLDEWGRNYEAFLEQGEQLRLHLEAEISSIDVSDVDFSEPVDLSGLGPTPTGRTPPSPIETEPPTDVAARIDETVRAVMADDEDENEAAARAGGGN